MQVPHPKYHMGHICTKKIFIIPNSNLTEWPIFLLAKPGLPTQKGRLGAVVGTALWKFRVLRVEVGHQEFYSKVCVNKCHLFTWRTNRLKGLPMGMGFQRK